MSVSWAKYFGKRWSFFLEKGDKINRAGSGFCLQNSVEPNAGTLTNSETHTRHLDRYLFKHKMAASTVWSRRGTRGLCTTAWVRKRERREGLGRPREVFRKFTIIHVPRNGIPSCFLFRGMVRNEIPGVLLQFCSSERNSEIFAFRGTGGICPNKPIFPPIPSSAE